MDTLLLAALLVAQPNLFLSQPITTAREGGVRPYCYCVEAERGAEVWLDKGPRAARLIDTADGGLLVYWDTRGTVAGERYKFRLRAETPDGRQAKQQWWVTIIGNR